MTSHKIKKNSETLKTEKTVTYVALLRGINVGGNNIIKMTDLKLCFQDIGFSDVKTYIASGNVIFSTSIKNRDFLIRKIESALKKTFHYNATIVLRSYKEMKSTVAGFPELFKNLKWKHNVIFLGDEINNKDILKSLVLKKEIETIEYNDGALYWSAQMKTITKSNMLKLSSKPEYKRMTVRNQNTTKKILEMME